MSSKKKRNDLNLVSVLTRRFVVARVIDHSDRSPVTSDASAHWCYDRKEEGVRSSKKEKS